MKALIWDFFTWRRERQELLAKEQEEKRKLEGKEQEIRRLSEDVVWFKRLMAHNVRMPLAIITGYGEMLQSGSLKNREDEQKCINKICRNIDYLDTVLKVLLDEEQELLEQKKHYDILACVREVAEYVKNITQKAGIKVSVNSSQEQVIYYGNRISLMRAFFNLIENSVRYMNRQGEIIITVEETETEILMVYRDNGEGMLQEEAEHITELNYQGSNGKYSGHGMGMYLIQKEIAQRGGKLTVKTGKGNGMGVYITLPKEDNF